MSSVSISSVGGRITYCRSAMHLTRKDFVSEWGVSSIPTLARWELNTVSIPNKKLKALVMFFYERGLLVTENWILTGEGTPPIELHENVFDEKDFDSLAHNCLLTINQKQNNFCFGQVKNNLLSPTVKYGDYIGGVKLPKEKILTLCEEIVFVLKGADLLVGICKFVGNRWLLDGLRGLSESVDLESLDAIGKIQWLIRRP